MMDSNYPRLRPHVLKRRDPDDGRFFQVVDCLGLTAPVRISAEQSSWLDLMDGTRSLTDIYQSNGKGNIGRDRLARLIRELEDKAILDGPRFREIVDEPVRAPRCIGCYEGDPSALRRQITGFFNNPQGPGLPGLAKVDGNLRGALIPHIDYPRGGITYAWGFKEVVERTDASLFVIIGTSHYSQHRFTLTRKHFRTPLGIAETDQNYIDRLVGLYGDGLFDDEWLAHLPEHSIELEVVFLQYLYETRRPIRIVPLVVGSFFDCVSGGNSPTCKPDIARMIEALRGAESGTPEPICYIISGDLAHIGPRFQDPIPLTAQRLEFSRQQDFKILRQAEAARPATYFKAIADEIDARNICGLSPTYTFLEALRPQSGKLLHYDQYVHPRGQESVSFASMAFYRMTR